jgi:hypothetical protein
MSSKAELQVNKSRNAQIGGITAVWEQKWDSSRIYAAQCTVSEQKGEWAKVRRCREFMQQVGSCLQTILTMSSLSDDNVFESSEITNSRSSCFVISGIDVRSGRRWSSKSPATIFGWEKYGLTVERIWSKDGSSLSSMVASSLFWVESLASDATGVWKKQGVIDKATELFAGEKCLNLRNKTVEKCSNL